MSVVLATWRIGAIYQPLFTAFGPWAIEQRVTAGGGSRAKLIVTDSANSGKLAEVANCPPALIVEAVSRACTIFAQADSVRGYQGAQHQKLAPPQSITSSARARIKDEIVRSSALAVLR